MDDTELRATVLEVFEGYKDASGHIGKVSQPLRRDHIYFFTGRVPKASV